VIRLALFIATLLLATGASEPSGSWLVAIAVLSGLTMFGHRERHAASIAVFVIALLLLTNTVERESGWLVALAALSGLGLLLRQADRVGSVRRLRRRWLDRTQSDLRWWWDWD